MSKETFFQVDLISSPSLKTKVLDLATVLEWKLFFQFFSYFPALLLGYSVFTKAPKASLKEDLNHPWLNPYFKL